MKKKSLRLIIPAIMTGVLMGAPAIANATVVITFMGVKICITGKKNPDGCKESNASHTVIVNDSEMTRIDSLKGKSIRVSPVREGAPIRKSISIHSK